MAPLQCRLDIISDALHLQQLYTGLSMLAMQQKINLRFSFSPSCAELRIPAAVHPGVMILHVNSIPIAFDMSDGSHFNEEYLALSRIYFKRSYDLERVADHPAANKILPYGLNYLVLPDFIDGFSLRRALAFRSSGEWLKQVGRILDVRNRFQYSPRLSDLQAPPSPSQEPRILFLARSWDSGSDDHFQLSPAEQVDRQHINEVRAECIRRLRREFGYRFTGGLIPTCHSKLNYPDCVVDQNGLTSKRNYIKLVKQHSICVATTGLHGSIGWKFAEYVTLSRAIVSEPLNYLVPGDFRVGQNYLDFTSIADCVEKIGCLMDSSHKRALMMQANERYYQSSLRPDQLIWNCLQSALNC